jgi:hypothetical protein
MMLPFPDLELFSEPQEKTENVSQPKFNLFLAIFQSLLRGAFFSWCLENLFPEKKNMFCDSVKEKF